jgi:ATP-dependent helicase HrpB
MSFEYKNFDLPIVEVVSQLQNTLKQHNTCLLSAPPGAGKSTLLPLVLLNEPWLEGKKIIVLEPRRLAAKSIAQRLSDLYGEPVGKTIGYRVRFDTKVSENTKIEVVTEGILTRMLHTDNTLAEVGMVIFDEFHERSIHADVSLALSRETQQILRPELRLLIMSATLDLEDLAFKLQAPVVFSQGRQHPVKVENVGILDQKMVSELVCKAVQDALKKEKGDILVFLPGQGEIRKCEEILRKNSGIEIHPLYGQLPPAVQQRAILPSKEGKRKIILATSIAETSLTIEGVGVVVDSGLAKSSKFDPNSGLSKLETHTISMDSAIQRAGRAGRLGPGVCYRVWSKAQELLFDAVRKPEILSMDLASLALDLASWGINDANELFWLNPPPRGSYAQSLELLEELGALEDGKITSHGKAIHQLPTHPRLAHLLIKAKELNCLALATDVCAILEEKDPFYQQMGVDLNLRVEALRRFRAGGKHHKLNKVEQVAQSYRAVFDIAVDNSPIDDYQTGLLLSFAFPERIACARPGNNAQFQLANGAIASFWHKDDMANENWIVVANLNANTQDKGTIFLASRINPTDLQNFVKKKENIFWDKKNGALHASLDLRIGNIILKSTPLPKPDESKKIEAICNEIKKVGEHLLNFDEATLTLINRIQSLRKWRPELNLPHFSLSNLCQTANQWLAPFLGDIKTENDLKKILLKTILIQQLSFETKQLLDQLAPESITVPSGSLIKITYQSNGESPILAVRLQECFGLTATPTINQGKTKLLMHLLSPGYKPVQVTSDLANFWVNTYFDVKKELKGRYPKHRWPDNPLNVEAGMRLKK